jgi:outer membrane protein OmpA-like peptidoglycan-associated protein
MDLAHVLTEDPMREPTPEIMRGVSRRLSPPGTGQEAAHGGTEAFRGIYGQEEDSFNQRTPGQHFDIFARENTLRPASWVMCWSDLMMTMFIMFAALYIFQLPKIEYLSASKQSVKALPLGTETIPSQPSDGSILGRIHDRLRDLIERDGLQDMVSARVSPGKSLHVVLSGKMLFAGGTALVRPEAKKSLLAVARILGSAPHSLSVVGHSAPGTSSPGHESSWEYSMSMAGAVAAFLRQDAGLPAERMLVAGYGDQRPVADGDGPGGAWRVELILSSENPTEPLPVVKTAAGEGFRQWIGSAQAKGQ